MHERELFAPLCQLQLPSHCGPCSLSACLFILGTTATQRQLARAAGRDPKSISITIYGQAPDRNLVQSLLNAGADRVLVRPEHVDTEAEMGEQLERMAEAVL